MNINKGIEKVINDNLTGNTNFEFIATLNDLTLSDINHIEDIVPIKSQLAYNIVDNIYIKIQYSI